MDRYKKAKAARSFKIQDEDAVREYIEAYAKLIHYAEGMHEAAMNPMSGHYPEGSAVPYEDK